MTFVDRSLFGLVGWFALVACKPPDKPRPPEHDDAPDRRVGSGSGSGSSEAPEATRFPPPPAEFATADFVTTRLGDVNAFAIRGTTIVQTGTTSLVKVDTNDPSEARFVMRVGDGDWADRDHLFVRLGDRAVVQITATAITKVPVPAPKEMTAPKPAKNDNPDTRAGSHEGNLILTEGEAWWSECAWGFAADGFQCESYVNAQLWPKPAIAIASMAPRPRGFVFATPSPAGFATRNVERDGQLTGIACEPPSKQGTKWTFFAEQNTSEMIVGSFWVSTEPPRLLMVFGHSGYSDLIPDRWSLHAGCASKPLATGTTADPGPAGLWLARSGEGEKTRLTIYRGGEALGDLPAGSDVMFRPTK